MNKISLDGSWSLSYNDLRKGSIDEAVSKMEKGDVIPCPVPGAVHMALLDKGIIEEPTVEQNAKKCKWMEEKEWWYSRKFFVEKEKIGDKSFLCFDGLDLTALVWLNGQFLGSHDNAFITARFDVTGIISEGENLVVVRLDEGMEDVRNKSVECNKFAWPSFNHRRIWMRKPQYCYGWDWTIRLPTCGIWQSVYIESYSEAYIRDVFVRSYFPGGKVSGSEKVVLSIDTELEFLQEDSYTLYCDVYGDERFGDGEFLISAYSFISDKNEKIEIEIENPRLWWPNGSGDPYLYNVRLSLKNKCDEEIHLKEIKHGFRKIELVQQELGQGQASFTFYVNDAPIFAKGANWIPSDLILGRVTEEKYEKQLLDAAGANMNMMRIWGGGSYASDFFMDTCDRLGILVWQDFMFACAYYPDFDIEFFENVKREAVFSIKRLRNRPSLLGWSGNNEIQEMYQGFKAHNKNAHEMYGSKIFTSLLPKLCTELDPDRIYRESSPFGGDDVAGCDEGDQHIWHFTHRPGYEHYMDLWRFTDFNVKFLSEFGVIGAMNIESARKAISSENLRPGSEEWLYHSNDSADHRLLNMVLENYFGESKNFTVQEYILKSQVIQAEIMRHIYDDFRCRKFTCSGLLFWTWNDSFGIHNWAVLDYYLARRPVYYYMKRASAPLSISFRGYEAQTKQAMAGYREYYAGEAVYPVDIFVINDHMADKEVTAKYRIMTMDGEILEKSETTRVIPANTVRKFITVPVKGALSRSNPERLLLVCSIYADGKLENESRYFFAPYRSLQLPKADVKYSVENLSDTRVKLTISSDKFVWMLHIATSDGVEPEDNDFDLYPGDLRTVTVSVSDAKNFIPSFCCINGSIE